MQAGMVPNQHDLADTPHNDVANPGLFTSCDVCHEPGTYVFDATIDNTASALGCHDGVISNPGRDSTTHLQTGNCVECHNPMRAQGRQPASHIRTFHWQHLTANGAGSDLCQMDWAGSGLCETCHTTTAYYKSDRNVDLPHNERISMYNLSHTCKWHGFAK